MSTNKSSFAELRSGSRTSAFLYQEPQVAHKKDLHRVDVSLVRERGFEPPRDINLTRPSPKTGVLRLCCCNVVLGCNLLWAKALRRCGVVRLLAASCCRVGNIGPYLDHEYRARSRSSTLWRRRAFRSHPKSRLPMNTAATVIRHSAQIRRRRASAPKNRHFPGILL